MTTYLLAGGGTAGHVNPLLALADLIRDVEPDSVILVVGTAEGLESRLVPERGYDLRIIERLPFPRRPGKYALTFVPRYFRAIRQLRDLIRSEHVDVVVGFGGYASAPAYQAAKREGVPVVVHEANAKPGLANILGAKHAKGVAVTFPGTPMKNATVTGMPLRPEISTLDRDGMREQAREYFGLDPDRTTLLITGGSLGARAINQGLSTSAKRIVDSGVQVIHVWGGLTTVEDPGVPGYHVLEYCDRMDLAFAACDLVVSRAGSTTVSEIAGLGIPAIFVPYSVGNGEQRFNAKSVVEAGGAILVEDEELGPEFVATRLLPLLQDTGALSRMGKASRSAGHLDGTQRLYDLIREII